MGLTALFASACVDPAVPPTTAGPPDLPRWSTAPHVDWTGGAAPANGRLLLVFIDEPGGPVDRLAADADVATFLNDRFNPLFLTPTAAVGLASPPAVLVVDPSGCRLLPDPTTASPSAWIAAVNELVVAEEGAGAPRAPLPDHRLPDALAPDHPLRGRCPKGDAR